MDLNKIKARLILDEGCKLTVYMDTEGNLTCGIGHEVVPADNLKEGDMITQARCDQLFAADLATAIKFCTDSPAISFLGQPELVQEVLVDLAFNMGPVFATFKTFQGLIRAREYSQAADDLKGTLWALQVPNRAIRMEQLLKDPSNV
jgi:lysozyme